MTSSSAFAYGAAVVAPICVAGALVGVRSELDPANAALLVVLVVVVTAALAGRGPALVSAVVGAVAWEFFFTRPYGSLRIDSADDLETTLILLAIGLVVSQVAHVGRRRQTAARAGREEIDRIRAVASLVASGASATEVTAAVSDELRGLLSLRSCRLVAGAPTGARPEIDRSGAVRGVAQRRFAGDELTLPEAVDLPVRKAGITVAHLELEADPEHGVSLEARLVAVAIADLLAASLPERLATTPNGGSS